jgi:hypothetical protein
LRRNALGAVVTLSFISWRADASIFKKPDVSFSLAGRASRYVSESDSSSETTFLGNIGLRVTQPVGDALTLYLAPRVNIGNDETVSGFMNLRDDKEKLGILELHEGYADVVLGDDVFVRAGKQIVTWGVGTIYSPVDRTITPRDNTDLLSEENRLGTWSVATTIPINQFTFTLMSLPLFTPTRFAVQESRWSPVLWEVPIEIERNLPRGKREATQWCASIAGRAPLFQNGVDGTLRYCEIVDRYGVPGSIRADFSASEPVLEVEYPKKRFGALELAGSIRDFGLYGELMYHDTVSGKDDDYFEYLIGGNTSFNDVLVAGDSLLAVLEYTGSATLKGSRANFMGVPDFKRPFTSTFLARLTYEPKPTWALELTALTNIEAPYQWAVAPKVMWRPVRSLELSLALEVFGGAPSTLFGYFRENRRAYLNVRYDF